MNAYSSHFLKLKQVKWSSPKAKNSPTNELYSEVQSLIYILNASKTVLLSLGL